MSAATITTGIGISRVGGDGGEGYGTADHGKGQRKSEGELFHRICSGFSSLRSSPGTRRHACY
jgi:hypothetical protein